MTTAFTIVPATTLADIRAVADLFRAYAESLEIDLAYQGFATELATLPGSYAPPHGALLLARSETGTALGCVALRPMPEAGCGEMKRLFVAPEARGLGLGRELVEAVVNAALAAGHREILLDTLPSMTDAQALYRRLGFVPIPPYYDTPIAGTVFLGLHLDRLSS